MEWVPRPNDGVVRVATPLAFNVPVPRLRLPSKNCTVPPGIPPELVTVAVIVTGAPCGAGLREDVATEVVVARVTVSVNVPDRLPPLNKSPP
jgi:hypothetical protein